MKYIDSEKLIAEIERLQEFNNSISNNAINSNMRNFYDGEKDCCKQLLSFIDSLQQEQPEQKKNCNDCPHCVDRKDQYGWHFKGCFGGPYNGKFIAEIDECPLKQEQPSLPSDLDEAARHVYESWMGGTMDDVRRDMVELGRIINAIKEEQK